jgi:hypothetical protein
MARPRIEIEKTEFEKLCRLLCTQEEIADWFDCSVDTLERWCKREYGVGFAESYKKYMGRGKIALRRYQMNLAKESAPMAIWLGKQILGQRDYKQSQEAVEQDTAADSNNVHVVFEFKDTAIKNNNGDK